MVKSKFKYKHIYNLFFSILFVAVFFAAFCFSCIMAWEMLEIKIKDGFLIPSTLILLSSLLFVVAIKELNSTFIKIKVDCNSICISTPSTFFNPTVYYINDFNGFYLTEESISLMGSKSRNYKFKVAWLSRDDTLMVRIPDFYRNFDKILNATNLKYKRKIESKEYKPGTVLSFCDELFETRFKSMTQAGLDEHQKEHKIVMEEKDAQKKEPQKTYNWNFNNNNDTI